MDLIIEGPEGDSVWAAYQDAENENENVAGDDDDEMEVQMLDDDIE